MGQAPPLNLRVAQERVLELKKKLPARPLGMKLQEMRAGVLRLPALAVVASRRCREGNWSTMSTSFIRERVHKVASGKC